MAERYEPGITGEAAEDATRRLRRVAQALERDGEHVRLVGATLVPGDEAVFSHFVAAGQGLVVDVHRRAGVPFARIVSVVSVGEAGVPPPAADPAGPVEEHREAT